MFQNLDAFIKNKNNHDWMRELLPQQIKIVTEI